MIIGVDKEGYVISVGILNDEKADSIKIVQEQTVDIITHNYKYEKGRIVDLGLKPEFAMSNEEKILKELKELDTVINRATEDLYVLTDTTPYKSTQEVIDRKEELRTELKKIK